MMWRWLLWGILLNVFAIVLRLDWSGPAAVSFAIAVLGLLIAIISLFTR